VTQTTLSVDDAAAIVAALRRRFPRIVGPKKDDICYATQNRQDAVKFLAPQVDVVIVVGSPNSSNSNRLREVAANRGIAAYMVDRADQFANGSPVRCASAHCGRVGPPEVRSGSARPKRPGGAALGSLRAPGERLSAAQSYAMRRTAWWRRHYPPSLGRAQAAAPWLRGGPAQRRRPRWREADPLDELSAARRTPSRRRGVGPHSA
jgi:hypothetical protein